MKDRTLLLIDDSNDHLGILENLSNHFRTNEGINLNCDHINPNDRSFWDESKNPDINKVLEGVEFKLQNKRPDLIIVDYDYSGIAFNGLSVIEKLRGKDKFKKTKLFMISGKRDQIVRKIFLTEDVSTDEKVKSLAKIINYGIEKFLDKDFKSEAIESLKRKKLDEVLPSKLRQRESRKLNLFNPRYKNFTMKELADEIEAQSPESHEIIDEMFELTIAHYLKIDENLQ